MCLFDLLSQICVLIRGVCKGVSGGIQLIPIGDFFQLAPVKSPNHEGKYCFCQPTGT